MADHEDVYRAVLTELVGKELGNIPDPVIDHMIDEVASGREPKFTPAVSGEKNIDHTALLELLREILVFAGLVVVAYQTAPRPKDSKPSKLTDEQKRQIERIVDARLKGRKKK